MDSDIDLTALRAFRAVIREGSFSAAAGVLRMPKSTLSKRVADLETDLGVRLIERTTRQLRVTTEGEILAARADRLLGEADDIRRSLSDSGTAPRGPLRISVPNLMGQMLMGRIAARFRAAYPDITLECHFLDRAPDLLEEGFDGAVRFGPLDDSSQVARLIQYGHAILLASPRLPGIAALTHPAQLAAHPLVGMATSWAGAWQLVHRDAGRFEVAANPALQLGSYLAVRDALIEGAGIALLPFLLARPEIAADRLVQVLPAWTSPPKPMYFVYPSAQSVTARLKVFIDFLVAELRALET